MTRQQRRSLERQLAKIDPTVFREIQRQAFTKGVQAGMEAMESGLKKEFGFGKKRLARLEDTIRENLKRE